MNEVKEVFANQKPPADFAALGQSERDLLDLASVGREEAINELYKRLPQNRTNLWGFLLIEAIRRGSNPLVKYAYENLHKMACKYLHKFHRQTFVNLRTNSKLKNTSEWDKVFHAMLFGDGLKRKGELARYVKLSLKENWANAQKNRYSGLLTRCGQRHIDIYKKQKLHWGSHFYIDQMSRKRRFEPRKRSTECSRPSRPRGARCANSVLPTLLRGAGTRAEITERRNGRDLWGSKF